MAMLTEKDLKAIEDRLNNAAPGPYRRGNGNDSRKVYDANDCIVAGDCAQRTGTFFANAHEDVRRLVDAVRALRDVEGVGG